MNQICDGYNPSVLMGNWQEQSYAVNQPFRQKPNKILRQADIDISYIDAHLKLRSLNRTSRMPHWNTKGLTQAQQFKNQKLSTANKDTYKIEVNKKYINTSIPHLYNKQNRNMQCTLSPKVNVKQENKQFKLYDTKTIQTLILHNSKQNCKNEINKTHFSTSYSSAFNKNKITYSNQPNIHKCQNAQIVQPNFRRIRSDITLKNIPLIKTQK